MAKFDYFLTIWDKGGMKPAMKPHQVRVYLNVEQAELVDSLQANQTTKNETWLLNVINSAALAAIKENGGRFPMPLRFAILDERAVEHPLPPKRKAA